MEKCSWALLFAVVNGYVSCILSFTINGIPK